LSLNGLFLSSLPLNGLPLNGLPLNGLPLNGLPLNGLPLTGWRPDRGQHGGDGAVADRPLQRSQSGRRRGSRLQQARLSRVRDRGSIGFAGDLVPTLLGVGARLLSVGWLHPFRCSRDRRPARLPAV
jgi:hypothetical protein